MSSNYYEYPKGSKSVSMDVFLQTTTGAPAVGLGFNAAGLQASYRRPGAVPVSITLVAVGVAATWLSGGFVEIDQTKQPGMYRVDSPDAVFAPGVDKATLTISGGPNLAPRTIGITLNGHVPTKHEGLARAGSASTIQLALTAPIVDNVFRDDFVDIIAGTGAGQSRFITGYVGATATASVLPNFNVVPDATSVAVVRSFGLDSIKADDLVDLVWDELLATHLVPGSFGARLSVSHAGTAQGGSVGQIQLATSADARTDFYKNQRLIAIAGAGAGQEAAIATYVGATKVATFVESVAVAFDGTTVYMVLPRSRLGLVQSAVDQILDAPIPRPTAVPTVWTLRSTLGWLMGAGSIFKRLFTKTGPAAGTITVRDDTDSTDIGTTQVTDDGTTTTTSETV